jgi:uncharacterized protein
MRQFIIMIFGIFAFQLAALVSANTAMAKPAVSNKDYDAAEIASKNGDEEEAAELYEKACNAGFLNGCAFAAGYYDALETFGDEEEQARKEKAAVLHGKICNAGPSHGLYAVECFSVGLTAKNSSVSANGFKKACDAGLNLGCGRLGYMYDKGDGVPKDRKRADTLLNKACSSGTPGDCYDIAERYEPYPGDLKFRQIYFYGKACDRSYGKGCSALARVYRSGKDIAKAVIYDAKACNMGIADSCVYAASMYDSGEGVTKAPAMAASLYTKGCDARSKDACIKLAGKYETGNGVATDIAKAASYYSRPCDFGYYDICYGLGEAYSSGKGVPKDIAKAATFFDKACRGNIPLSCAKLAEMYANGNGVTKDLAKAFSLYSIACERSVSNACTNQGILYYNGWGTAKDTALAVKAIKRALEIDPKNTGALAALSQVQQ